MSINPNFASVPMLRERAKKRIPRFAFEYLDGGCNNEVNLKRNTDEIRQVQLNPYYLKEFQEPNMKTTLFGKEYDAPFGIAPVGLQGLMWPGASEILAKAAFEHNIPYILSTVGTATIEEVAKLTEGNAWFQLYYPKDEKIRLDIIKRCADSELPVLVLLADVPTFGIRPKEIRNGLSIPPKITVRNMIQIMGNPNWAIQTLIKGQPTFKVLKPYVPKGLNLKHLGLFMNQMFSGRVSAERIKPIRDMWKGKLVLKGVATEEDTEEAIKLGFDGIIISNHGGRQLDSGKSTIECLKTIAPKYKDKITIMMDSGIRTGPDIANTMAHGADFTFMGRSPMYGVAALGKNGGDHTISILKRELQQVMEQVNCGEVKSLYKHLV